MNWTSSSDPGSDPVTVQELELSLENDATSPKPTAAEIGLRSTYYYLLNIDQYPEMRSLAQQVIEQQLLSAPDTYTNLPKELQACQDGTCTLQDALASIERLEQAHATPWNEGREGNDDGRILHFFRQYTPIALVDGCWLQGGLKVPLAHTQIGSRLALLYAQTVRPDDPNGHYISAYRVLFQRLWHSLESPASPGFIKHRDFLDFAFELPVLLLSFAQLPRAYLPELLGVNLAWQYMGKATFGAELLSAAGNVNALQVHDDAYCDHSQVQKAQVLALGAAEIFLEECPKAIRDVKWRRLCNGLALGVSIWLRWIDAAQSSVPLPKADPYKEMIELVRRKAAHAHGYHGQKRIGDRRIDDWFNPDTLEPEAFLQSFAGSRFIVPGDPENSPLLNKLVQFGGPMVGVFSKSEQLTVHNWIKSLASKENSQGQINTNSTPELTPVPSDAPALHSGWSRSSFRRRSFSKFSKCSVRELYYYLANVEYFPGILPVAEQFVQNRLERAACTIHSGVRPIPCTHYDSQALESWVFAQHRRQVESYRPFTGKPRQSKEAFIEATTQLAPLVLIDGSWIQNIAHTSIIHTSVGRLLFKVLFDELGLGDSRHHHANLYRELLSEMGGNIPPFDSLDFAQWDGFEDNSFDIPVYWLGIACFPRQFLPEILGLNLAVEIAGIGGPYLEAYDALKYFRFNTWFVEVHNAADNVSVGHTAYAVEAIKTYMDDIVSKEGPRAADQAWLRVWTGLRSTLPQCSHLRVLAHRMTRRILGTKDN